jgi:transmembrane sensor
MTPDFSPGSSHDAGSPDWDAIARFLAGESAPAEATTVRAWLDAHPRERDLLERLDSAVNESSSVIEAADVDTEAALARVHERIATMPRLTVQRGGVRKNRYVIVGVVAAAAVAAGAVFFMRNDSRDTHVSNAAHTYATNVGQRDSVLLADGSRVTLGPRSTLVVPADYAAHRSVQLTGDAYFDVRHDAAKPFSVRVGNAVIEDIGTTFSVESDVVNATSVSVVSGSVRLRADSAKTDGVVLEAGDRGEFDTQGRTRVARDVVKTDDVAWIAGRLVFRNAPLSRVAAELQRWYGVTLKADDSILYQRHVSAEFRGEPIDQVLKILGLAIDARIDRQGDSATVHSSRGGAGSR